jgi:hypothetical protein
MRKVDTGFSAQSRSKKLESITFHEFGDEFELKQSKLIVI